MDVDDVEAVVEVLAEAALGYLLLEVAIGGGHDADVGLDGLLAAHALELAVLEDAEDLDLHVLVDFAYLVQEEGALVRELEAATRASLGPGEGSLLVAEELALEEALREGRAVDLDEGPSRARREVVDGVRHELLAHAALARDEDARLGGGHAPDEVEDLLHAGARADDGARPLLGLDLGLELLVLARELARIEGPLHEEGEVVEVDRLRQEIEGAVPHGLDRVLDGAVAREDDDGEARVAARDLLEELAARERRHAEVGDDEIDIAPLDRPEPFRPVGGCAHPVAVEAEGFRESLPDVLLVVHDEYGETHQVLSSLAALSLKGMRRLSFCGTGRLIVKVEP